MNTIYRLRMSDGQQCQKSAASAGEAIYYALNKHPGLTVSACHSGMTEEEAEQARRSGKRGAGAIPGVINYDIPPHKAVEVPGMDTSD